MGALIVLFAITPVALELDEAGATICALTELALMICVIAILYSVRNLKARWIQARHLAEVKRYESIGGTFDNYDELRGRLDKLLGGSDCQIHYNRLKHDQYHHMERTARRASTLGFAISMLAATTHLFFHAQWLLYLTAALPTFVGAVHGINSFLQLSQLSEDHLNIADRLGELKEALEGTAQTRDFAQALLIAKSVYEVLTEGASQWKVVATRLQVTAP
jgi:hypothetical protein